MKRNNTVPRPCTQDDTSWVNPIAGKTKETQSHEKFILSVGYFALSTPGDCILLGTKVFSPQVPPRLPAGTCRLGLTDR